MERIVTNLVKLYELKREPCERWLKYFNKKRIADAHEAFIQEDYYDYYWLYENSNIDLIAWEIENNCFDWKKNSLAVAELCPYLFDPEKYNWEDYSSFVAMYCPDKIDPERFNWKRSGWAIIRYCPDKLDPDKFPFEQEIFEIIQLQPFLVIKYFDKIDWNKIILLYNYSERKKVLENVKGFLDIPEDLKKELLIKLNEVLFSNETN